MSQQWHILGEKKTKRWIPKRLMSWKCKSKETILRNDVHKTQTEPIFFLKMKLLPLVRVQVLLYNINNVKVKSMTR